MLSLLPQPKEKKVDKIEHGKILGAFIKFVSITVTKYWYIVLIIVLAIVLGFVFTHDKVDFNSNYMD